MNVPIVIPAPFMTAEKFAEITGQTVCAVKNQLNNHQLPIYNLPPSSKQKDKASSRRRLFVDTSRLAIEGLKRAGKDVTIQA